MLLLQASIWGDQGPVSPAYVSIPTARSTRITAKIESGTLADLRHLTRTSIVAETERPPSGLAALAGVHDLHVQGVRARFDVDTSHLDEALGQNLFAPPNVKGWPGGESWIDAATLLGRKQWLERTFRGGDNLEAMRAMADYEARAERARETVADARYQLK